MKTAAADNLSQDRHIYIQTDRRTDMSMCIMMHTLTLVSGHEFIDRMENQGSLLP